MNKFITIITMLLVLFAATALFAMDAGTALVEEGVFMDTRFLKICEKVILFLKENPDKSSLDLDGLLKSNLLTQDEYDFLITKKIKYNPPSSAGPFDNYLSIFDRENEDGTSSHILYDIVDKKDPAITKTGTIDSLHGFLEQWHAFPSDDKSMFIFNDQNFYYFTICYYNNRHWNKQHVILISFPENNIKKINSLKTILEKHKIEYRNYVAQSNLHFDVKLPSGLLTIKKVCKDILEIIFMVSPNSVINYTPDGFRFENQ